MSEPQELAATTSEAVKRGGPSDGLRGLDYYRRLRPFDLVQFDEWGYSVYDVSSGELFGNVCGNTVGKGPLAPTSFRIEMPTLAAPAKDAIAWNNAQDHYSSAWEVADQLWRIALPVKSRFWLLMRRLVLGYDWLMASVNLLARVALALTLLGFAVSFVLFMWEVRGVTQEILMQWLESVRDGNATEEETPAHVLPASAASGR